MVCCGGSTRCGNRQHSAPQCILGTLKAMFASVLHAAPSGVGAGGVMMDVEGSGAGAETPSSQDQPQMHAVALHERGGPEGSNAAAEAGQQPQDTLNHHQQRYRQPRTTPAGTPHYWGQALQYLDRAVGVEAGKKITLLARWAAHPFLHAARSLLSHPAPTLPLLCISHACRYSSGGKGLSFALRQGVGEWVGRAPWKIEWGGGASVENPHYQRVHYCELLVSGGSIALMSA
jgi:protein arginine N-methyltransferase 7